jgi:hypothetical protein
MFVPGDLNLLGRDECSAVAMSELGDVRILGEAA